MGHDLSTVWQLPQQQLRYSIECKAIIKNKERYDKYR